MIFSDPTVWFLNLKPEVRAALMNNLHDKKVDVANHGVTIKMEHLDKQRQKTQITLAVIYTHGRRC